MVSRLSANTNAFGIVAPRRLSMIGCGIATTSALMVRVHCCIAGAAAGAMVVAAVLGDVVVGVSGLTDSVSALGEVAGLRVLSETGAASLIAELVAELVAGAGFGSEALRSATALSAGVAGVCPLAITAVSKLKVSTINEAKIDTGDLEPSICVSFYVCCDEH